MIPTGLGTPKGYPTFFDEGSAIHAGKRIAEGEHLYTDMLYFKAPLSYYGLGLIFRVSGPGMANARIAGAAILSIIIALSALMAWQIILPKADRGFPSLFLYTWVVWIFVGLIAIQRVSWHNSWCVCALALASIIAYLGAEKTRKPLLWMLAGALAGTAFLTKQSFGICLCTGAVTHRVLVFAILWQKGEFYPLKQWFTGFGASLAAWIVFALIAGNLKDFFQLAIMYPLSAEGLVAGLSHPLPDLKINLESLVFYAPPALILFLTIYAGWSMVKGKNHRVLFAYGVLALFVYGALFPRSDMGHLRPILPVAIPGIAFALDKIGSYFPSRLQGAPAIIITILIIFLLPKSGVFHQFKQVPLSMERAQRVMADAETARILEELISEIQHITSPDEPIFVAPWAPLVYFLSERTNPTRVRIIWPGQWNSDRYLNQTIARIESARVQIIIWVKGMDIIHGRRFEEYAPAMHQYISGNFTPQKSIGRYVILKKNKSLTP